MKAAVALGSIERLERLLDQNERKQAGAPAPDPARFAGFSTLRLDSGIFAYPESGSGFKVGPLDRRSGAARDVPGGRQRLRQVDLAQAADRPLPAAGGGSAWTTSRCGRLDRRLPRALRLIFSDFHLFDRLYGIGDRDPAEVKALIARMGLADKMAYRDGRFTNLDLSTGQRKRLALIASFLEDRPIYVFDEWAADQDPEFRARFYEEIIPELTARGQDRDRRDPR